MSLQQKRQLCREVTKLNQQLLDKLLTLKDVLDTLTIPAVSRVVPPKVQKSFNSKVLRNLGLLESRLHLVAMHDAVWELGSKAEEDAFVREIPYVARMMIDSWRRSLYLPRAGALDYGSTV